MPSYHMTAVGDIAVLQVILVYYYTYILYSVMLHLFPGLLYYTCTNMLLSTYNYIYMCMQIIYTCISRPLLLCSQCIHICRYPVHPSWPIHIYNTVMCNIYTFAFDFLHGYVILYYYVCMLLVTCILYIIL